jgi:hypothetical protein
MRLFRSSLLAAALLAPGALAAQTFDFQALALGNLASGTVLTAGSAQARFSTTGTSLSVRDISSFGFGPGSNRVLSTVPSDEQPTTMEFLNFTTNSVTFRNWISGVWTSEVDEIVVRAFNGGGTLLNTVTSTAQFITITGTNIARLEFDDINNSTGYMLDEINVGATVVPEPSTYALIGTGLAGLALIRRRRRA